MSKARLTKFSTMFVLAVLACALFLVFAPREKSFNPYSPWETSSKTVDARMEGVTFHIPGNYLRTLLERSKFKPDELADGFLFHALMPDFLPFSLENKEAFIVSDQSSRVVYVSVDRTCRLGPRRPDAMPCTVKSALNAYYTAHTMPRAPKKELSGTAIAEVPGMVFEGVRVSPAYADKGRFESEIYVAEDEYGNVQILKCDGFGRWPNPQCRLWYAWRDIFIVSARFPRSMKNDWADIRDKTNQFLSSISDWPHEAGGTVNQD